MKSTVTFLLTPDSAASRRLRRLITESSARLGVIVGTWTELVQLAERAYLTVPVVTDWREQMRCAASAVPDAFWSRSLEVAPDETLECLDTTLTKLLYARLPAMNLGIANSERLSERGVRHLSDLNRLHEAMARVVPHELAAIVNVLDSDSGDAQFGIVLYRHPAAPSLSVSQKALAEKIEADFGEGDDPEFIEMLVSLFKRTCYGATVPLTFLQTHLFTCPPHQIDRDSSLQWVAVRDYLEEVEVVAGMIQHVMAEKCSLVFSSIGILLPDSPEYLTALSNVFSVAGIPLSGLPSRQPLRDIGHETVGDFIRAQQTPAPGMASASLFCSPLMPWSRAEGARLAQAIMDGDGLPDGNPLTALILETPANTVELSSRLNKLRAVISAGSGPELHLGRAHALIGELLTLLAAGGDIDWNSLEQRSRPGILSDGAETSFNREGVSIFLEPSEPWRQCRLLFVLGFSSGRYPGLPTISPVFSQEDIHVLKDTLGFDLERGQDLSRRRRELFIRQLSAASGEICFFTPRRDGTGGVLHPSETLTFMAQLFSGIKKPEELLLDIDNETDRGRIRHLALAAPAAAGGPRALEVRDPDLGCDLLASRIDREGKQKPESPSGLEVLLVSPLAWLFQRYGLEPKEWATDMLDVMTKGSLAHSVFEQLFVPDTPLPDRTAISLKTPTLLTEAIRDLFPLLELDEWRVERRHLERDIEKAALRWGELLRELGASVVGVEVKLTGVLDTLPISGKADLLVTLPGKRMLVVDYKKSGSKARLERMKKGYDSQANLYRIMMTTGGAVDGGNELVKALKEVEDIGVMYYLLNDQTAISDSSDWTKGDIAGLHEMGAGTSDNAMAMIRERIRELEVGQVVLNTVDDEEWYKKKAGITPYAFDKSPLIRMFMKRE